MAITRKIHLLEVPPTGPLLGLEATLTSDEDRGFSVHLERSFTLADGGRSMEDDIGELQLDWNDFGTPEGAAFFGCITYRGQQVRVIGAEDMEMLFGDSARLVESLQLDIRSKLVAVSSHAGLRVTAQEATCRSVLVASSEEQLWRANQRVERLIPHDKFFLSGALALAGGLHHWIRHAGIGPCAVLIPGRDTFEWLIVHPTEGVVAQAYLSAGLNTWARKLGELLGESQVSACWAHLLDGNSPKLKPHVAELTRDLLQAITAALALLPASDHPAHLLCAAPSELGWIGEHVALGTGVSAITPQSRQLTEVFGITASERVHASGHLHAGRLATVFCAARCCSLPIGFTEPPWLPSFLQAKPPPILQTGEVLAPLPAAETLAAASVNDAGSTHERTSPLPSLSESACSTLLPPTQPRAHTPPPTHEAPRREEPWLHRQAHSRVPTVPRIHFSEQTATFRTRRRLPVSVWIAAGILTLLLIVAAQPESHLARKVDAWKTTVRAAWGLPPRPTTHRSTAAPVPEPAGVSEPVREKDGSLRGDSLQHPPIALQLGAYHGVPVTADLRLIVDASGRVVHSEVLRSTARQAEPALVEAARTWRFTPGLHRGLAMDRVAVELRVELP